jgi:hypothetical protein
MHHKYLVCRVCGYLNETPPWGEDGKTPSFEICPCCGVEFGYEDATPQAVRNYRANWLARGAQWFIESLKPTDWDVEAQMANIPEEYW